MYKIHINETPLILVDIERAGDFVPADDLLVAPYTGRRKQLLNYVDMLEKSNRFQAVVLHSADLAELWNDFRSHFKLIEAAGGVVRNPEGKVLVIYRRGYWDLPKGKIDPGESPEEAGVREVMEETGIRSADLLFFLMPTYHIYREKGKRVLKHTHWFAMEGDQQELLPEEAEKIDKAEWRALPSFLLEKPKMHANVVDLLEFTRIKKFLT